VLAIPSVVETRAVVDTPEDDVVVVEAAAADVEAALVAVEPAGVGGDGT